MLGCQIAPQYHHGYDSSSSSESDIGEHVLTTTDSARVQQQAAPFERETNHAINSALVRPTVLQRDRTKSSRRIRSEACWILPLVHGWCQTTRHQTLAPHQPDPRRRHHDFLVSLLGCFVPSEGECYKPERLGCRLRRSTALYRNHTFRRSIRYSGHSQHR